MIQREDIREKEEELKSLDTTKAKLREENRKNNEQIKQSSDETRETRSVENKEREDELKSIREDIKEKEKEIKSLRESLGAIKEEKHHTEVNVSVMEERNTWGLFILNLTFWGLILIICMIIIYCCLQKFLEDTLTAVTNEISAIKKR